MESILLSLRSGPKTASELARVIAVSEKTLYKRVNRLVDEGGVIVFPFRMDNHKWASLFALPEHRTLAATLSGYIHFREITGIEPKIKKIMEDLQFKLFRNPDVDEVILEIGENPEDRTLRDAVYRIGSSIDWKPPTSVEREKADAELSRILKIAAWMRRGYLKPDNVKGDAKLAVEKAKEYLKRFPHLVPKI